MGEEPTEEPGQAPASKGDDMDSAFDRLLEEASEEPVQQGEKAEEPELPKDEGDIFIEGTSTLLVMLEDYHQRTRDHSERVAVYCVQMGLHLGLSEEDLFILNYAALLHDIGKTLVPVEILDKEGGLTKTERILIETHTAAGYGLVMRHLGYGDLAEVVRCHHERNDGTGYAGLEGEEIPFLSRIIAVADSYDAMTTEHAYRQVPLLPDAAMAELRSLAGTRYEPSCVDALEKALSELGLLSPG